MPFPSKVTPEEIVSTAVELVEDCSEELSMRTVAARLGIRVSSLYRYFEDRSALEAAVAARAARLLKNQFTAAAQHSDGLGRALKVYRRFARRHTALYRMMLAPRVYDARPQSEFKQLWIVFLNLVGTVTGNEDDTDAAVALWSFLHGFIALEQSGQFGPSGPKRGFEVGMAALLRGLKASSTGQT